MVAVQKVDSEFFPTGVWRIATNHLFPRAEAVAKFQTDMLAAADPQKLLGDKVTVVQAMEGAVSAETSCIMGYQIRRSHFKRVGLHHSRFRAAAPTRTTANADSNTKFSKDLPKL